MNTLDLRTLLANVRETKPLIHCITNYVTVNDCANILLACGASPIMADDIGEAAQITALCAGLDINIGTLNAQTIPSMLAAGRQANQLGRPVLLDPVGAGASLLRTETALKLMEAVRFTVIRGNMSEIKALALGTAATRGVDAVAADGVSRDTLAGAAALAKGFARQTGAVMVITGAIDIVADGERAYCVYNGHPMMAAVTGTGCQLSALICAFLAANRTAPLEAAAAAVCAMGLCGETARARMQAQDGNASMRGFIIDAVYNLTGEQLERGARYEVR